MGYFNPNPVAYALVSNYTKLAVTSIVENVFRSVIATA